MPSKRKNRKVSYTIVYPYRLQRLLDVYWNTTFIVLLCWRILAVERWIAANETSFLFLGSNCDLIQRSICLVLEMNLVGFNGEMMAPVRDWVPGLSINGLAPSQHIAHKITRIAITAFFNILLVSEFKTTKTNLHSG